MFSLTRIAFPRLLAPISRGSNLGAANISCTAILRSSDDPMLTVGPWPRTKEERIRAAKKYNLIPEDYEPYDENDAFGDYPKLKAIGAFNRDPYDDFDDTTECRFYGEVYHKDNDLYYWERIDPLAHEKKDLHFLTKLSIFVGMIVFFPTLNYLSETYRIHINHPKKQRLDFPDRVLYEFPNSH